MIDFDYSLDEIVGMDGSLITLRSALRRMPAQIGVVRVLFRDLGKKPAFFDASQIQALWDRHHEEITIPQDDAF